MAYYTLSYHYFKCSIIISSGNKGGDTLCFFERKYGYWQTQTVLDIVFFFFFWHCIFVEDVRVWYIKIGQKQCYCPSYYYVYQKSNSNYLVKKQYRSLLCTGWLKHNFKFWHYYLTYCLCSICVVRLIQQPLANIYYS